MGEIQCVDCVEGMKKLDIESVDLTVTSPPYDGLRTYNGFVFDFPSVAEQLYRVTKPGGVVVWVVGDQTPKSGPQQGSESGSSFRQALGFKDAGFRLHDTMIFAKSGMSHPERVRYHQAFEYMFVFSKGKPKTFNPIKDRPNKTAGKKRNHNERKRSADGWVKWYYNEKKYTTTEHGMRSNIWEYPIGQQAPDPLWKKHPAVFPLALAMDHVKTWSKPGELVLDPFVGSGQTVIAADELGRQWLGMDLSQEYCDLARERVEWYRARRIETSGAA
jgi:DNA modification methylase